ncbi:hypothetical protein HPP92_021803 [Vanilla planifolia]|uniref:Fe2OG dioxygenase domain-containing protein n=1 Tax=Vanilla planifolia TaxID=51239 RepID=A0A835PZT8_VANPL|nr:hypothetical protein HPP92_021803 [Vanilla planifolia]
MPSLPNEHFDIYSARNVPDSHSWPTEHHVTVARDSSFPVVDISAPGMVVAVGAACRSWGAFYVTGHGVPEDLLRRVEAQARRLFALPHHRKLLAARRSGSTSGYGPPPLSSFFPKLMWSEGFTLAGDPLDVAAKLWQDDHSLFCEVMEEYGKEMKKLANRLMKVILLSLGLDEEKAGRVGPVKELTRAPSVLQLNSYPPCPEPDQAMGMAAHTDSGFLTVLHQSDGAGGLQVVGPGEGNGPVRWIAVPPRADAFVVNVGDLFHILSNGRFKSVRHRVVVNRGDHRVSAAYFIGPPADVKVGPIRWLLGSDQGPVFRPVTWPEYLGIRARLFDKALDSVRLPGNRIDDD